MTKKIFAMFLAVLMVVSMLPTSVFAAKECPGAGNHTKDNCDCTVIEVTAPTCGEAGFTTYMCNDCYEVFADDMKPATGVHNMVAGEAKAPTCGEAGYEAGTECDGCGLIIPGAAIDPVVKAGISCEYKDMTPDIDCTTGGVKTWECVVCHDSYTTKINKGEHTWNFAKLSVKVAPTAEAAGIAVIPCAGCSATKEIEWFGDHNCYESVQHHDAVAPTCTANGEIEHYECRVCGKIYADAECKDELRANEFADSEAAYVGYYGHGIITLGGHSVPSTFTQKCTDQTVKCPVCEEKWTVPGAHDYETSSEVAATCVTPGYKTKVCKNCGLPVVKTTEALGHISKTVSVPATCGTFAYTFTYCLREGCQFVKHANATEWLDEAGIPYSVKVGYSVADVFMANGVVAYNLSLTQKNLSNKVLYLTGAMNGYYLATSNNAADAAAVVLVPVYNYKGEAIANSYKVKLGDKYINIYERYDGDYGYGSYKGSVELVDTAAAASTFVLNTTTGVMTVTCRYGEYFLCAYNKYETVGASSVSYLDSSFAAVLNFVTVGGVDLIADPVVNEDAGYDLNKHNTVVTKTPATCAQKGEKVTTCANFGCDYYKSEEIAVVDHKTKDLTTSAADIALIIEKTGDSVNADTVSKAATCTAAGYKYVQCEYCGQVFKKTIAATGHYYETKYAPKAQAASHTSDAYYYYTCKNGCGEKQKFNVTPWKYANTVWDTYEEALDAHPGIGAENTGVLYRDGNCTTTGLIKFVCNGTDKCGKVVYVKQWKTLKDKNGADVLDPATNTAIQYLTGQHTVKAFQLTADIKIDDSLTLVAGAWIADLSLPMYAAQPQDGEMVIYNYYMDATCSSKGYIFTYECACCGAVVGSAAKGTVKLIDEVAHYYVVPTDDYNDDVNPCPNGVPYECMWCHKDKIVFASAMNADLCTSLRYEYYECSCGEEHIRGLYGKFGHELVNVVAYAKSTHTEYGYVTYKCTYCDYTKTYALDKTPHENKAEEEFTDKCTDTETDRHCVLCCTCADKGDKHDCTKKNNRGTYDCACMIPSFHHWAVSTLKDSTCTMLPYQVKICNDCEKQTVETAASYLKGISMNDLVAVMDGEDVLYYNFSAEKLAEIIETEEGVTTVTVPAGKLNFKGHKPAEIDYKKDADGNYVYENGQKVEVRYGNYVYIENYTWTSYEWVAVNVPYVVVTADAMGYPVYTVEYAVEYALVEYSETYTAKFEAYTEETYSTDGYFKAYCQICDAVVEQVNAKKAGIGFEMDFANANGAAGYGYGSLVEVTVSLNALNASVYGFEFNIAAPGMLFVGYELANDDFSVTVSNPKTAYANGLKIVGHAVNTLDGKMQNISITEKTALVKLYFRAIGSGKVEFNFVNASAQKVENATAKTLANIDANYEDAKIKVRGLLDFNNDGSASAADLYQAMSLLTGEHPNGLVYDVTVDLNKDGEVTLEDLSIGYNYLVGNVKATELLMAGMSDAEIELLMVIMGAYAHECVSPFCNYAQSSEFAYCPACGFRQN